jgi:hypothetical protein
LVVVRKAGFIPVNEQPSTANGFISAKGIVKYPPSSSVLLKAGNFAAICLQEDKFNHSA